MTKRNCEREFIAVAEQSFEANVSDKFTLTVMDSATSTGPETVGRVG